MLQVKLSSSGHATKSKDLCIYGMCFGALSRRGALTETVQDASGAHLPFAGSFPSSRQRPVGCCSVALAGHF